MQLSSILRASTINDFKKDRNMDIKKVDLTKEPMDEKNYVYAVCECILFHEGLKISRPKYSAYIRFNCPCCNKELGIVAKGKLDILINR